MVHARKAAHDACEISFTVKRWRTAKTILLPTASLPPVAAVRNTSVEETALLAEFAPFSCPWKSSPMSLYWHMPSMNLLALWVLRLLSKQTQKNSVCLNLRKPWVRFLPPFARSQQQVLKGCFCAVVEQTLTSSSLPAHWWGEEQREEIGLQILVLLFCWLFHFLIKKEGGKDDL